MKKLFSIWMRFLTDFFSAIVAGTFLSVVWFYIIALLMILAEEPENRPDFPETVLVMIIFHIVSIAVCCIFLMFIRRRPVHRVDYEFIGDNFIGFGRKSRTFRRAHKLFREMKIRNALELFTELDSEAFVKSREEQAVISFFRARCYHVLSCMPNAVLSYERAVENGFDKPETDIFLARAYAENGSAEKALDIFTGIMDTDHKYSQIVRAEIGQMYLKRNDGENALKWFSEAIELRQSYAEALGGAAVAHTILNHIKEGEELYRMAILNHIEDSVNYTRYFKEVQAAVVLEKAHAGENEKGEA